MRNGTRKQFMGICTVTGVLLALGAPLFVSEAGAQQCSRGTTPNVACRTVVTPADRNPIGPEHQSQFPGGLPRGQYASGVTTSIPYAGTYNSMRYGIGPREFEESFGFGFGPQVTVTEYIQREQGSADLIWVTTAQGRRVPFVTRGNELVSEEQPTGDLRKAYATKTAVTITDPQTEATVVYGQIARNVIGLPSGDELLMPTKFIDSAGDTVTTMTYQASAPHILASIEDRFGNKTTFTMVNGVIKTMTNPDGVTIGYTYDQRPGEQLAHLIAVSVPDPKQNTVWTGEWDPTYRHLLTKFSLNGAQPSTTEIQYANPSGVVEAVVRAHNGKDQTFTGYVTTEDSVLVRTESAIDQKAVFSFTQYADSPTGDGKRYPVLLASGDGIYNKDKNSGVVSARMELGYYGFPVSSTDMWGRTLKVRYVEGDGCSDRSIGATSPFPLCSSSAAGETRVKRLAINGAPTEVANFDPTGKPLAVTTITYDAKGLSPTSISVTRDTETSRQTTTYDAKGRPLTTSYRTVEQYQYNKDNYVTRYVSPAGTVTENIWNASQLLTSTTDGVTTEYQDGVSPVGERTTKVIAGGLSSSAWHTYDGWQRSTAVSAVAGGNATKYTSAFLKGIDGQGGNKYTYTEGKTKLSQPTGKIETAFSTKRPPPAATWERITKMSSGN